MVYLDDIIVFSKNRAQHRKDLECVLAALEQHQLSLNPSKCHWAQPEISFLGYLVDGNGIKPLPAKLDALSNWPTPTCLKDARSVSGLLEYFRRFVKDFAKKMAPVANAIVQTPFSWSPEAESAMRDVIADVCAATAVRLPIVGQRFIIDTDASGVALGAVLQQEERGDWPAAADPLDLKGNPIKESTLRPLAFASSRVTDVQSRYSAQELECLGICKALDSWRGIIEGSPIIVRTDHEPLKYVRTQGEVGNRLRKFVEHIEHYEPYIVYRTGKSNTAADALSRATHGTAMRELAEAPGQLELSPLERNSHIDENSEMDAEPDQDETRLRPLLALTIAHEEAIYGDPADPAYVKKDGKWWKSESIEGKEVSRLAYLSVEALLAAAEDIHRANGHYGSPTTSQHLYHQLALPKDAASLLAKEVIAICETCQYTQKPSMLSGTLSPIQGQEALELWGIDFIGPIHGDPVYKYIATAIDYGTGWAVATAVAAPDTVAAIQLVNCLIRDYGAPAAVICDNGPAFRSDYFAAYMRSMGIAIRFTAAYHPQTNGKVERMHQDLKNSVRRYLMDNPDLKWVNLVDKALLDHRNHLIEDLGVSPAYLLYGRELRTPNRPLFDLNLSPEQTQERVVQARLRTAAGLAPFRRRSAERSYLLRLREALRTERQSAVAAFDIGDKVLRYIGSQKKSRLDPNFDGPWLIRGVSGSGSYSLQALDGHILQSMVNKDQLVPAVDAGYRTSRWRKPNPRLHASRRRALLTPADALLASSASQDTSPDSSSTLITDPEAATGVPSSRTGEMSESALGSDASDAAAADAAAG
jgi:transposase InsO family protein